MLSLRGNAVLPLDHAWFRLSQRRTNSLSGQPLLYTLVVTTLCWVLGLVVSLTCGVNRFARSICDLLPCLKMCERHFSVVMVEFLPWPWSIISPPENLRVSVGNWRLPGRNMHIELTTVLYSGNRPKQQQSVFEKSEVTGISPGPKNNFSPSSDDFQDVLVRNTCPRPIVDTGRLLALATGPAVAAVEHRLSREGKNSWSRDETMTPRRKSMPL